MIKQLFQTDDGSTFNTAEEADLHEQQQNCLTAVANALATEFSVKEIDSFADVTKYLLAQDKKGLLLDFINLWSKQDVS